MQSDQEIKLSQVFDGMQDICKLYKERLELGHREKMKVAMPYKQAKDGSVRRYVQKMEQKVCFSSAEYTLIKKQHHIKLYETTSNNNENNGLVTF